MYFYSSSVSNPDELSSYHRARVQSKGTEQGYFLWHRAQLGISGVACYATSIVELGEIASGVTTAASAR